MPKALTQIHNSFVDDGSGTLVELEEGDYQVTEFNLDPTTPQTCANAGFDAGFETGPSTNVFVCTDFSPQCQGHNKYWFFHLEHVL